MEDEKDDTTYATSSPYSDCLVGITGELYSVHDLKHDLVNSKAKRIFITLDCCRDLMDKSRGPSSPVILRFYLSPLTPYKLFLGTKKRLQPKI